MTKTFPIWQFHQTLKPDGLIVYSQEQFDALEKGYVDSPLQFEAASEQPAASIAESDLQTIELGEQQHELADKTVAEIVKTEAAKLPKKMMGRKHK